MMPKYEQASYGGETVTLSNKYIQLEVHRRITGWGWAEVFTSSGKYLCVLEHFGELMLRDQEMPVRMEADHYERKDDENGVTLIFQVKSMIVQEKLKGTSFDTWVQYPFKEHLMEGEVTITLPHDEPLIRLSYRLKSKFNLFARYVRGPWVKVGANDFGSEKVDAIMPGVEWLIQDEWSSGTDWFKDPWAQRYVPHPNKVAIPVMAVSHSGTAVGLAWNPNQRATNWFNYRSHRPQPVFASPNFIDRKNNHLMGLMVPDVDMEAHENQIYAEPPLELHPEQEVEWDAEIFVSQGNSLDSIMDWVKRHGLPAVPEPRWPYEEALKRIAAAYNTRYWHEDKGFGSHQNPTSVGPYAPRFMEEFVRKYSGSPLANELQEKMAWCQKQPSYLQRQASGNSSKSREEVLESGRKLLSYQKIDGSYPFDPDGRHYRKDDFIVAREFVEPMGLAGDTALDMCVLAANELIEYWKATNEEEFRQGAIRALEYCMNMIRPEGGDFWETPLHSPNLFAAGHAATTYYSAYLVFGDVRYKEKAVYWIRSVLPFTHLWQPNHLQMIYNTKPCFCSSDWYLANWVRDHVQWEVLETFAASYLLGINWAQIDLEIDWDRYQEGITNAALRWMIDHKIDNWQPHNMPWTKDLFKQGLMDDSFADTHNSVTGNYGGMGILPDVIAVNLIAIIGR